MTANAWFRLYNDVLHDPKVQLLPKALRWAWVELLCLASKNGGVLPPVEQIAFAVRASVNDAQSDVDALILAGLIDIGADGRLTPHNWGARQFISDNSTERSRKHRENKKKRECNVAETLPATPPDQIRSDSDTDSEPDQSARARKSLDENFDDLGSGRGGSVSVEAKRSVCALLGIGSAEPLIAIYEAWSGSLTARDPDALFRSQAPSFFAEAPPDVRRACQPHNAPEPLAAVAVPSPQLIASLGGRHARTVRSH